MRYIVKRYSKLLLLWLCMADNEEQNLASLEAYEASKEDIPLLAAIEEGADTLFHEKGITEMPPAASVEKLSQALQLLIIGSPPVGFALIEEVGSNAHLEQLSVEPSAMGHGLGTKLLHAACKWAKQQGYPAITLMTFRDIPWNAPFYARNGFQEVTEPSPAIQKLIKHEKELGMHKLGARVAMMKGLG